MRLLLDTHVAIWAVLGSERLACSTMAMIADPANAVRVSVATLWEIGIKNNRGGQSRGMDLTVAEALREFEAASFDISTIEARHAAFVETLPLHHRDPFDRMLVAQAAVDVYRLVTHDQALAAYGEAVMIV